ncbi:MAG: hypothetical protein MnENMB40S_14820 [Rhizobiaceae bacterium MnEN-MB40S]|nr:MAG: hypothetical protein MnENMB40S_14820 [Rhizobiaceae bacterium MnEN-MB40S]
MNQQTWGGKSPAPVFEDCADLERAAGRAAPGIFYNQGQGCSAASRIHVHSSPKPRFVDLMVAQTARYAPGDPLDPESGMGAMVDARQAGRVMRYVNEGRRAAQSVAGGNAVTIDSAGGFIEPTIFRAMQQTNAPH